MTCLEEEVVVLLPVLRTPGLVLTLSLPDPVSMEEEVSLGIPKLVPKESPSMRSIRNISVAWLQRIRISITNSSTRCTRME